MSALHAVLGNATDSDRQEVAKLISPILVAGEAVTHAFRIGVRDQAVFTSHRLVVIDKQGFSGKKLKICSYPYKFFQSWSMKCV